MTSVCNAKSKALIALFMYLVNVSKIEPDLSAIVGANELSANFQTNAERGTQLFTVKKFYNKVNHLGKLINGQSVDNGGSYLNNSSWAYKSELIISQWSYSFRIQLLVPLCP